jgi:putative ABC transport system substrate-binding protein
MAMRRREFIATFGSAVAWPLAATTPAAAQQGAKSARIGVLTPADSERTPGFDALRKELRNLGYLEGKSIFLDFRLAKGHAEALPGLAAELVQIPVDVIVAAGTTAALAAANVTHTIPIVQGAGGDLVRAGLAASLARPGGNVTGFTILTDEPSGKRLDLLRRAAPTIKSVTVMLDPTSVVTAPQLRATEGAAATLGIRLAKLPISTPEEVDALRPAALAGSDGLVVLPGAMFYNHRATIVALAAAARVPAIYPSREYADDGGLIAYGPNVPHAYRRAAGYVDRILRGAKPGDLPIEEASKLEFIVNFHTALQLGLRLPIDFVVEADEVIE